MSRPKLHYWLSFAQWLLLGAVVIYGFVQHWRIKQVQCLLTDSALELDQIKHLSRAELDALMSSSNSTLQPIPEICQQMDFLQQRSLFFYNLDTSPLFSQVVKNDKGQAFQVVRYYKRLPHELVLLFTKQDPSYRLVLDKQVFLVNQQDFICADDQHFQDLPLVRLDKKYKDKINHQKIERGFNQQLLNLVQALLKQQVRFETIVIAGQESYVTNKQWRRFIFDFTQLQTKALAAQLAKKIVLIQQNLEQSQFEGQIQGVDMRFDLPVVRTDQQTSPKPGVAN